MYIYTRHVTNIHCAHTYCVVCRPALAKSYCHGSVNPAPRSSFSTTALNASDMFA